jgi:xanthine dehydrogenase accessory factor
MQGQLDFFERIAALGREGLRFATATVVGRRAPVSAHLGDRAIVFADGRMEGFVGGACSREIVRKQALESLASGTGRIVSIRPDATEAAGASPECVVVPMTCASEGAIDVYIEPFVQARRLVVVGGTPIAAALARVARSLDYRVVRVVDDRERADLEPEAAALGVGVATLDAIDEVLRPSGAGTDDRAVVVASQGHYDEETLEAALRSGAPYVGLVASRARGAIVRALLEERNVPGLAGLRNPAGLDLGARTPPEVALSILAEIVQTRSNLVEAPAGSAVAPDATTATAAPASAIDPVCGMEVDVATARHEADFDGVTYYFCCAGCRARFVKQPRDYAPRAS